MGKKKVNRYVLQGMLQLVSFQKEYCLFDNNTETSESLLLKD